MKINIVKNIWLETASPDAAVEVGYFDVKTRLAEIQRNMFVSICQQIMQDLKSILCLNSCLIIRIEIRQ